MYREIIKDNLLPFWDTDLIHKESLTMFSEGGKPAEAMLLFQPDKIMTVSSATLDHFYEENVDWVHEDGKIKLTKDSRIFYFTEEDMYPKETDETGKFPKTGGGFILFSEGSYFHERQISVTYQTKNGQWKGAVPTFEGDNLPHTMDKILNEKKLKLTLFGDSISAGANASGHTGAPPYLPRWGELAAEKLRQVYQAEVLFSNPSVGGKTSAWGAENVAELVSKKQPDLVILAFGMNDGTGKLPPEEFEQNLRRMMRNVRSQNPDAEFLIVTTMLPNPLVEGFLGNQPLYRSVGQNLAKTEGVLHVDMMEIHEELLKKKRFLDMTGNNVNHPNDYLIRWYAQVISAKLCK